MNSIDDVRIYNQSCPPLDALLRQIKRRPAEKLGHSVMPVDGRYAAGVWKRLFVLALKRMAINPKSESLARLTAVEALRIVGASASPSRLYPRTAPPRYVLSIFRQSDKQPLQGRTSPRNGFHPRDLHRWKCDAVRVLRNGYIKDDVAGMWKRWGGGPVPKDLMAEIRTRRKPNSRALALLARFTCMEEGSLRITLHRHDKARNLLQ